MRTYMLAPTDYFSRKGMKYYPLFRGKYIHYVNLDYCEKKTLSLQTNADVDTFRDKRPKQ